MNKADLRKLYLEKRADISPTEVAQASRQIADRFFENVDLTPIIKLHTFIRIPKFNEIDTSMIYYRLWRDHADVVTVAPRVNTFSREIESIAFDETTEWNKSALGIREPVGDNIAEPSEIDAVVVPLLCFDKSGHRVGYGKGMYDRFLSRCRIKCLKVGLSYFPPEPAIDDLEVTDMGLDMVITAGGVHRFK